MSQYTGGCACDAVRFEVEGEPEFSFHCQCRQCQHITGTGHASLFMVKVDNAQIDGELHYYKQISGSGNEKSSGFCPECGSPIVTKSAGYPEVVFFHAASLDDPSRFKPEKVVYSASGQPWDFTEPNLQIPS